MHSLASEVDIETEQNIFEIYYTGFLNRYYEYSDKSTTIHKFGAVNTYLFSENDNPLNVGLNYTVRINKEDYFIYDFNQISAYANYMHSISESNKVQLGVIGNRIDYKNFSLFSHYQLIVFLRSINSFESRMSITAAAEIDQKIYVEKMESEGLADEVAPAVSENYYFFPLGNLLQKILQLSDGMIDRAQRLFLGPTCNSAPLPF